MSYKSAKAANDARKERNVRAKVKTEPPKKRHLPKQHRYKSDDPDKENGIKLHGDTYHGLTFMGVRDTKKVSAIFAEIDAHEKAAEKLVMQTAKAYYNAGNILANAIRNFNYKAKSLTAKAIADASGFSERRIMLALKIFKHFENNPDALNGLTLRDSLKLIAPPPAAGEEGYNRVDLGGNAGQINFDFGELFKMPSTVNSSLQSYRTIGEQLTEIVVVKRANDGSLISKRFAHFGEEIPQDPTLRMAYKTMSQKTQAAIEDYLAALEQSEQSSGEAQR
ncbi:MAG: hypothetical protein FWB73_03060 [Treponema sp.]|nr:hypothetical protein [Treponema sp.]